MTTPFSIKKFPQISENAVNIANNVSSINNNLASINTIRTDLSNALIDITSTNTELTRIKSIMANVQEVVYKGNKDLNNASNDNEWQSISEMTADLTCVSGNSSLLVSVYLNASLERSDAPLRIRLYFDKDDSGSFSVLNSTLANSNGSNRMRSSFAVETDEDYGVSTGSISALIQGAFDNDGQKITIRLYYNIRDYDARLNRSEYSSDTNRSTLTCSSIILQEIFVS
jgi:uncharacterized protein YrzB (UPF0473 family)